MLHAFKYYLLDSQRCYFESKKKDFLFSSILHCWFKHVLFDAVVLKSWTALHHIDNLDFYCKLNFGKRYSHYLNLGNTILKALSVSRVKCKHTASLQWGFTQRLFWKQDFVSTSPRTRQGLITVHLSTKEMPELLSCRILISTSIRSFRHWQAFCSS